MPSCDALQGLSFIGRDSALKSANQFANQVRDQLRTQSRECSCEEGFNSDCTTCFERNSNELSVCAQCVADAETDEDVVFCVFSKTSSSTGSSVIVLLLLGLFLLILVILLIRYIDIRTRSYRIQKRKLKKTYAIYSVLMT